MDKNKYINVYVSFVLDWKGRDYVHMPYPLILWLIGLKLEALMPLSYFHYPASTSMTIVNVHVF